MGEQRWCIGRRGGGGGMGLVRLGEREVRVGWEGGWRRGGRGLKR